MRCLFALLIFQAALAGSAGAATFEAPINGISAEGVHERLGTVTVSETKGAVELLVRLEGIAPGFHAMHVHENPDCGPALQDGDNVAGGAAGMHFDPTGAMKHAAMRAGPRDGKALQAAKGVPPGRRPRPLGDLPAVHADEDGVTDARILTYRLTFNQLRGRSLVIHAHPEETDDPRIPKGGGEKIACAVFPDD